MELTTEFLNTQELTILFYFANGPNGLQGRGIQVLLVLLLSALAMAQSKGRSLKFDVNVHVQEIKQVNKRNKENAIPCLMVNGDQTYETQ